MLKVNKLNYRQQSENKLENYTVFKVKQVIARNDELQKRIKDLLGTIKSEDGTIEASLKEKDVHKRQILRESLT